MATFDDKLLGEKLDYYCSSSEDEDDGPKVLSDEAAAAQPPPGVPGGAVNTGPKGVVADWRRFKQLEAEKRAEDDAERIALMKKLSLSCRTDAEDQEARERERKAQEEMDDLFDEDDEFMRSFMQKRMEELMDKNVSTVSAYGKIIDIHNDGQFLDAVDSVAQNVVVVIYLTDDDAPGCDAVNGCLVNIAKDYDHIKFCRMKVAAVAGCLSSKFKDKGVPAILAYKGGEQIISLIRITDKLGEDFYADDLEGFLQDNGVLHDRKLLPANRIRGPAKHADHSLSDEDS